MSPIDKPRALPPLLFVIVRHDSECPGALGDMDNCICNPIPEFVDQQTFAATVQRDMDGAHRQSAEQKARRAKK